MTPPISGTVPVEHVVPGDAKLGILLLHGLTGTPDEMQPVAEAFAGRYPLWVARVAGHGTSVGELARTSWSDWYGSAVAGADALLRVRSRIVVIGLSMGALLALRLAVERREAVAGVALLSPAIALRRSWLRWLGRPFRLLAVADARLSILQRLLAPLVMTKGGSDIADVAVRAQHPGYRQVPLRALLNLLRLQRLAWDAAPALTQPTLMMHAANDHTCPVDAARTLFDRLGSRDKRMVVLDQCFHVVTVDCERARVLEELERFVAWVDAGPSSTDAASDG